MNGNLAVVGYTQGLNVLLNMFFGPAVNTARGIAVQVQGVCQQFCGNFQMALNPQLTKSYAKGDLTSMHSLLIKSSKFSFYILYVIAVPLIFEANSVLKLWLGIVPEYTVDFLRLILVVGLLYTIANPIIVSVHATGKLKKFQIIEGTMLLMIVPIAYFLLKVFGIAPEFVFVVHIIVEIFTQYARVRIVLPMIQMKLRTYLCEVILPIVMVAIISPILPYLLYRNIGQSLVSFFAICSLCVVCVFITVFYVGCNKNEQEFLVSKILGIYKNVVGRFRKR